MRSSIKDVLIVGAGPTGLTLATSLTTRGFDVAIVDRQLAGANTSRAGVVHARTLEMLERIGVAEQLARSGIHASRFTIRDRDRVLVPVEFGSLPTSYPYTLMISQAQTEHALRERFAAVGGHICWGKQVTDVMQNDEEVVATLDDGTRLSSRFLVGADGMHSVVRERLGIAFPGAAYESSFSLADVRLIGAAPRHEVILYFSPAGLLVLGPLPGGIHRVVATVDEAPELPDASFMQQLLDTRGPERERAVVTEVLWGSRFRVYRRMAESFRAGRVLLAGDAAHVHSPAGGQGMNTGIQDAIVLADALVATLGGGGTAALDAYAATRRPIAMEVTRLADRLTRLATLDTRIRPLRNTALTLLSRIPAFRRALAWRLSGLVYRPA